MSGYAHDVYPVHFVGGGSKRVSSQNNFLTVSWTLTLVDRAVDFTSLTTLKKIMTDVT